MYESIHQAASALSVVKVALGFVLSIIAVRYLRRWTLGPPAWWKAALTFVYIAAVATLFFFAYAIALHMPFERWMSTLA